MIDLIPLVPRIVWLERLRWTMSWLRHRAMDTERAVLNKDLFNRLFARAPFRSCPSSVASAAPWFQPVTGAGPAPTRTAAASSALPARVVAPARTFG